jgi:hypothetical protein
MGHPGWLAQRLQNKRKHPQGNRLAGMNYCKTIKRVR